MKEIRAETTDHRRGAIEEARRHRRHLPPGARVWGAAPVQVLRLDRLGPFVLKAPTREGSGVGVPPGKPRQGDAPLLVGTRSERPGLLEQGRPGMVWPWIQAENPWRKSSE